MASALNALITTYQRAARLRPVSLILVHTHVKILFLSGRSYDSNIPYTWSWGTYKDRRKEHQFPTGTHSLGRREHPRFGEPKERGYKTVPFSLNLLWIPPTLEENASFILPLTDSTASGSAL